MHGSTRKPILFCREGHNGQGRVSRSLLVLAMSVDPKTGKVIPVAITVAGMMDDPSYQRCKRLAEELSQLNRHTTYNCVPLVETDWQRYLQVKQTVRLRSAPQLVHSTSMAHARCMFGVVALPPLIDIGSASVLADGLYSASAIPRQRFAHGTERGL